jgi:hypothetical protein
MAGVPPSGSGQNPYEYYYQPQYAAPPSAGTYGAQQGGYGGPPQSLQPQYAAPPPAGTYGAQQGGYGGPPSIQPYKQGSAESYQRGIETKKKRESPIKYDGLKYKKEAAANKYGISVKDFEIIKPSDRANMSTYFKRGGANDPSFKTLLSKYSIISSLSD